jgi:hypothetical protein
MRSVRVPPEAAPDDAHETSQSIALEAPSGVEFEPVMRLVLGGIAARADMGLEELDDLQLAVERLLAEAGADGRIRLTFDVRPGSVRTRVGPLRANVIAEALQGEAPPAGELGLRRVLATVVDSFGVESAKDGAVVVRLEKRVRDA